jgi:putative aldouronate transport system substrate-binding protein
VTKPSDGGSLGQQNFSRRQALRLGLGATAGVAAAPLIAACGSSSSGATTGGAAAALPDYVPYTAPGAAIPASNPIVLPAYYSVPTKQFSSVTGKVGNGETISMMLQTPTIAPTKPPKNAFWAELNKKVGLDLQLEFTPGANYEDVFGARLAAKTLPDIVYANTTQAVTTKALTEGAFLDLTPYVTGKNIRKYPNLSHLQKVEWDGWRYNGRFYGIATYNDPMYWTAWYRADIATKPLPRNAKEFLAWAKALTDPSKKRWALNGASAGTYFHNFMHLQFITQMFRVPYLWSVDKSGNFTFTFEYASYKTAINFAKTLYNAGVFYPDSWVLSSSDVQTAINSGQIVSGLGGWDMPLGGAGSTLAQMQQINPAANVVTFPSFGFDGGRSFYHAPNSSTEGFMLSRELEGHKEKIETCLRYLNYQAAPFGSKEWFFLNFGVESVDYTMQNGTPTLNARGQAEVPILRLASPDVLYKPGAAPAQIKMAAGVMAANAKNAVDSAGTTLFSETWLTKGQGLLESAASEVLSIVLGHKPMSYFDTILNDWKSNGGDQIRKEYEAAWHHR